MNEYMALVWALAISDFKLRYVKTRLGLLWAVLLPFTTFFVLYVVFSWMDPGRGRSDYVFGLLLGIILWSFFFDATSTSIVNIIGKRALIRNVPFPVTAVTTAACIDSGIILLINLTIFLGALMISGTPAHWMWLAVIPLTLSFFALTAGIASIISTINVVYRDIQHIWSAALQLGFFLSPIIYPVSAVPAAYQPVYLLNPVALVIQQGRDIILGGDMNIVAMGTLLAGSLATALLGGIFTSRMHFNIREEL